MFVRKMLLGSFFCGMALLTATPVNAALLLHEQFNTDGTLLGMSASPLGPGDPWAAQSGSGNKPIMVSGGSATLDQSSGSGEDIHVGFANDTSATATTYYRLEVTLPTGQTVDPNADGLYFAHLGVNAGFRARVGVVSPATGGDFRFWLGNDSGNASSGTLWGADSSLGTTYTIVNSYNAITGEAKMWVDPVDENSTSITIGSGDTGRIFDSFALRQSDDYTGSQVIDNICVATSFGEAFHCVPEPASIVLLGMGFAFLPRRGKHSLAKA